MRRRRVSGVLLPGVLFVALGCVGVVTLYAVAAPEIPGLPGVRLRGAEPGPRGTGIDVTSRYSPSPSPSLSPSARPTPPPSPTSTPAVTRTPRPAASPAATRSPAGTSSPAVARCRPETRTLAAVADAYVDQAAPATNYGAAPNLFVASRDKERNRRSLVRFALPRLPAGCSLRSATLTLTAKDSTGRRLLVRRAARSWDESRVTWGSAPLPTGTASAATVSADTVTWTVTGQVGAMLAGGNHGFVLSDAAENSSRDAPQASFHARSTRRGPTLTVTWG